MVITLEASALALEPAAGGMISNVSTALYTASSASILPPFKIQIDKQSPWQASDTCKP